MGGLRRGIVRVDTVWFVNQRGRLFDVYVNVTASEVLGVFCACVSLRGSRLWVG